MRVSLRLRLALIYTTVFAFVLLLFGAVLYLAIERHLLRSTDEALAGIAFHAAAAIAAGEEHGAALLTQGAVDPFAAPGVHVQLLNASGEATAHSPGLSMMMSLPGDAAEVARALAGVPVYYTAEAQGERIRVYNLPLSHEGAVGVLQVGKSYHDLDLTLARLAQLTFLAILLALLVAGSVGWAVAGRALRPVAEITETALAVAEAQAFDRRLRDQPSRDEIGQMARAFNHMLARLEAAHRAQQRFAADASHELRAPLTTITGNLAFLLRARDLPAQSREEALADALAEAQRMGRLVNDLLSLARADAGQKLEPRPVSLHLLVDDLVRETAARAREVTLRLGRADEVSVSGDPDRLKQLVLILLDNALKYTPAGGVVDVALTARAGCAELSVSDTGVGIEAADLPYVFERFYRADKARAREDGGAGLGLAIAKSIADEHGATIAVQSEPGRGSVFTVSLPRLAAEATPRSTHALAVASSAGGEDQAGRED